ncbi:hypothetical protein [Nocardioides marmoribigeumensis]|uniref:Uncharacterized protein n=1 Tax=Nocardioides marmoribigeumensis TaxID=433649 RepID=A0ABU2BU15_9ACTN|nr:hypothetical protein [Nocardioides marmoribigeumensis]MDR7362124.1 hypothetical protein [Nocardioides marmoribigeumensis]
MTASDVERRLAAVLHQHAEDAMNRTDTLAELDRFHDRVDQDSPSQGRRRAGIAAAALTAAAVGAGVLWIGLGQGGTPSPVDPAPPAASPPPSSTESGAPQAPGSTVEGFEGVEFPLTFVVPRGFSVASRDTGTRLYSIEGTSGGAGAFLISTLAGAKTSDLPEDLAAHLRETRDDLVVSGVGTTEVGGRPAQTFALAQKPGTAPSDLFCVRAGSCFKLLQDKPMDVTAVRIGRGLVLFWVEYLPTDQAKVQGPMQAWLSSVRWE